MIYIDDCYKFCEHCNDVLGSIDQYQITAFYNHVLFVGLLEFGGHSVSFFKCLYVHQKGYNLLYQYAEKKEEDEEHFLKHILAENVKTLSI